MLRAALRAGVTAAASAALPMLEQPAAAAAAATVAQLHSSRSLLAACGVLRQQRQLHALAAASALQPQQQQQQQPLPSLLQQPQLRRLHHLQQRAALLPPFAAAAAAAAAAPPLFAGSGGGSSSIFGSSSSSSSSSIGIIGSSSVGGVRSFVMMPRRVTYRKAHKSVGFNSTRCPNTRQLAFGLYGIRAMEHCRMPARTIEAARRTMRRAVKKSAMLWIRITPNVPVTSKPAEVRMGKGKGSLDYWAAPVRPGQVLFEFDRCSRAAALEAMRSIEAKLPIKVGFLEWS